MAPACAWCSADLGARSTRARFCSRKCRQTAFRLRRRGSVVGGRQRPPGVRDFLSAQPARGGGELPGRKPIAFCAWLFDLLGMLPGDTLIDRFPGSGIVGRAWQELATSGAPSRLEGRHFAGRWLSPGAGATR